MSIAEPKTPVTAQPMAEKDIQPPDGVAMGEPEPLTQPMGIIRKATRWLRGDEPSRQYKSAVTKAAASDVEPNDVELPPRDVLIDSRRYQRHFVADVRGYRRFQQALADLAEARKMREQGKAMPLGDPDGARARSVLAPSGVFYVDSDKRARQSVLSTAASVETNAFGHLVDLTIDPTADSRASLVAKREAAEARLRTLETTVAWVKGRDELLEKLFDADKDRLSPMARAECERSLDKCEAELSQRRGVDTAVADLEVARQKVVDLDERKADLARERFRSPKYNWLLAIER